MRFLVYVCEICKFTFERMSPNIEQCPDCGKHGVRPALPEECEKYEKLKQELRQERY